MDRGALERMTRALAHRGPDGEGFHVAGSVGFGHRRLAIIDPAGGRQPWVDPNGDALSYNGEVYNYPELRRSLSGAPFASAGDTEVVMRAMQAWGDDAPARLFGMFAFAWFDAARGRVFLARDRLGIKPLFYALDGTRLVFASEFGALAASGMVGRTVDPAGLAGYLRWGYVQAPGTIYRDVRALEPGTWLAVDVATGRAATGRYWALDPVVRERSEEEALEELNALLDEVVAMHVRSDVPFGTFLSGGVDSSLVAGCMTRVMGRPPLCFTAGFAEKSHDESPFAAEASRALGAPHRVARLTAGLSADMLGRMARQYGEPFADSSAIPTSFVCEMAAAEVKMVLSGDGGDELFAGYDSYAVVGRWLSRPDDPAVPWTAKHHEARDCFDAAARRRLMGGAAPDIDDDEGVAAPAALDPVGRCRFRDLRTYLPGDILTKVDRASMAHSLEVRVPLLDHRLVEFAFSLPAGLTLRPRPDGGFRRKHLLKRSAERFFPQAFVDRPKKGFGIPVQAWLDGPLRPLVHDLLMAPASRAGGVPGLDWDEARRVVASYYDGSGAHLAQVWFLLMLRLWADEVHRA